MGTSLFLFAAELYLYKFLGINRFNFGCWKKSVLIYEQFHENV